MTPEQSELAQELREYVAKVGEVGMGRGAAAMAALLETCVIGVSDALASLEEYADQMGYPSAAVGRIRLKGKWHPWSRR